VHFSSRRGKLMEIDDFGDLSVDERIILKQIFKKYKGKTWTGFIWFRIGTSTGVLISP
jgi:hypothetical protein